MSLPPEPAAPPPTDEPRVGSFLESAATQSVVHDDFITQLHRETGAARVTLGLVILNSIAFIAAALAGADVWNPSGAALIRCGANFPPLTTDGEWWRLVTATFLHIGLLHLGVNMYALWGIGAITEKLLGRWGMTTVYLLAGIGGCLTTIAFQPFVISAGASGAIFGLMGGLLGVVIARRSHMPGELARGLRNQVLIFLGVNAYLGFQIQGIDWYAHGGGFVCGMVSGWLLAIAPTPGVWLPAGRRIALVAIAAFAVLVAGAAIIPHPPDIDAVVERFAATERALLARQQALLDDANNGRLSDAEFQTRLKTELLPQWVAARGTLDVDRVPSPKIGELLRAMSTYAQARIELIQVLTADGAERDSQFGEKVRAQSAKVAEALAEVNRRLAPEGERR